MGTLFIVATPIGNLSDITLRAIETLKQVDAIVCEDSRVTGLLLHHLEIKKEMTVIHDSNEENKMHEVIEHLEAGKNLALVSDAGTPLISDPGFKLVRQCIKQGITVIPIPGPDAITTALSASGLPTDRFLFLGFAPDSEAHKKKFFSNVLSFKSTTMVFFESPHKLLRCLDALFEVFGDIEIVIAREMTKIHEEFLRVKVSGAKSHFEKTKPKGEFVILFRT